ncbi:MAG: gliding motility protein GldL, partial [Bacteroidota bacterium]|nr:gliding motility protein GldL [Bacteroidota bacterium]
MNLSELVQSSGWKNFMSKLYGWGASVVMIGALFKIQHYPGASVMLMVGLCTESIIFFFSAFEPLHEELDWTLVYPELAGMTDTDEIETYRESAKGKDRDRGRSERQSAELETGLVSIGGLDEATIAKLNESIGKLSQTSAGLVDITEAASATKDYAQNIKLAAESVGSMNQSFNQNSVQINDSMTKLSDSYQNTANLLSQSGNDMAQKVNKSSEIIEQSYTKLS